MPNGKSDIMAQAVYLAQLEAAKNSCKCTTCRILRKGTKAMQEQFLGGSEGNQAGVKDAMELAKKVSGEVLMLDEEDE